MKVEDAIKRAREAEKEVARLTMANAVLRRRLGMAEAEQWRAENARRRAEVELDRAEIALRRELRCPGKGMRIDLGAWTWNEIRQRIASAAAAVHGSQRKAARALEVPRSTLGAWARGER